MKILIYGAGSVGLGLASCLIKSGNNVDLVARPRTVQALKENGLSRTGLFGAFDAKPQAFGCYADLEEIKQEVYDFILVCVKSFDSGLAAQKLSEQQRLFKDQMKIILCQNGWGNAEIFLERFSRDQIYNARVITGFYRPKPYQVEITVHADAVHVGSLWGQDTAICEPLCQAISEGDLPCETTQTIARDLWAKMLYNCALNPLGAVLDVPYGALAEHQMSREIMEKIIKEMYDVMDAAGLQTHWSRAQEYLEIFYDRLVPATAEHRSSTLQSLKAGKKTELDALNGAVIRLAHELSVPVPVNQTVYQIVKFLEQN